MRAETEGDRADRDGRWARSRWSAGRPAAHQPSQGLVAGPVAAQLAGARTGGGRSRPGSPRAGTTGGRRRRDSPRTASSCSVPRCVRGRPGRSSPGRWLPRWAGNSPRVSASGGSCRDRGARTPSPPRPSSAGRPESQPGHIDVGELLASLRYDAQRPVEAVAPLVVEALDGPADGALPLEQAHPPVPAQVVEGPQGGVAVTDDDDRRIADHGGGVVTGTAQLVQGRNERPAVAEQAGPLAFGPGSATNRRPAAAGSGVPRWIAESPVSMLYYECFRIGRACYRSISRIWRVSDVGGESLDQGRGPPWRAATVAPTASPAPFTRRPRCAT